MLSLCRLVSFAVWLSITCLLGNWATQRLLKYAKKATPKPSPSTATTGLWDRLVEQDSAGGPVQQDSAGRWLGYLERVFFFCAFYFHAHEAIAGWLAFKVASKWNVWTNIVAVPKEIPGVDPVDYLIVRRRWGARVLTTFLVGSLSNVIAAFFGAAIAAAGPLLVGYCGR